MIELSLKRLQEADIVNLTPIMKSAFDYDAQIHLNVPSGGPDGYDDGTFLHKWAMHPHATAYCVYAGHTLIGAFILWIKANGHNALGCIFIDPKYENQGIGLRVWQKIESMYPDTVVWHTETPAFSHRNHHFYVNKCGFQVVKIDNPHDFQESQFIFQKVMKK